MCGIVGSINSKIDLNLALQKIKHRGPDAQGLYENQDIQFGHVRLSIIDLSEGANQPFCNSEHESVLIFNGEIYNYKDLKLSLEKNVYFLTESDTEVLYHGFRLYGIDFLKQLRGMFAFAFHDAILRITYLVRDRYGIKPLYYKNLNEGIVFASEIKALLLDDFTVAAINQERVFDFIYNRRQDHTNQTFFTNINQLPPGTYLSFNHETLEYKVESYYQIPCFGQGDNKLKEEELKIEIEETVKQHMLADVPIGAFLSGGIDSSVVSHVMSKFTSEKMHTVSGRTVYDHAENKLIDVFLQNHSNVKSIQFELDGSQFYEEIFNVIYHHDEPILDGSMFSHYMLCKQAKANGIKVLLSGSGGDEVFGGYESHAIGFLAEQLKNLQLRRFLNDFSVYTQFHSQSKFKVCRKILAELINQNLIETLKKHKNKKNLLKINGVTEKSKNTCTNTVGRAFERSIKYYTVPPYLHYEDRNSMAFGVEIRVPFLDHKLIEYVSNIRMNDFFDGRTKSSIRQVFKGELSNEILFQRKKEGFPSPIDTALSGDEKLKKFYYDHLEQTPFLNIKNCKLLGDDFYHHNKNLTLFWRVLSYMIWVKVQFNQNV